MKLIALFFLLCQVTVSAGVVDYCFNFSTSLKSVHQHLNTVLSPQDKVIENDSAHCLNVVVKNNMKEELYRKWINRKFQIISHSRDSGVNASVEHEYCRLEVEEASSMESTKRGVSVARNGNIYETNTKGSGLKRSSLVLDMGTPGSLRIDQSYINVTCTSQNKNRVFLDIALTDKDSSVASSVTLERGKTLDLAEIVEDLNNKNRKLSLQKGVKLEKTKGTRTKKYLLRIKD